MVMLPVVPDVSIFATVALAELTGVHVFPVVIQSGAPDLQRHPIPSYLSFRLRHKIQCVCQIS